MSLLTDSCDLQAGRSEAPRRLSENLSGTLVNSGPQISSLSLPSSIFCNHIAVPEDPYLHHASTITRNDHGFLSAIFVVKVRPAGLCDFGGLDLLTIDCKPATLSRGNNDTYDEATARSSKWTLPNYPPGSTSQVRV